jgi:hypothetical protein
MSGQIDFYVDEADVELVQERLNADPEIAFIVPEGPGHWRAVWRLEDARGKTLLWHVPAGPLPLLSSGGAPDTVIENPFAGWRELRRGFHDSIPYFGPSEPRTLLLELIPPGWRGLPLDWMPVSGVSWFGRGSSRRPHPSTRQWWQRFRSWLRRHARLVEREGFEFADVWALPAAQRAIQSGVRPGVGPLVF